MQPTQCLHHRDQMSHLQQSRCNITQRQRDFLGSVKLLWESAVKRSVGLRNSDFSPTYIVSTPQGLGELSIMGLLCNLVQQQRAFRGSLISYCEHRWSRILQGQLGNSGLFSAYIVSVNYGVLLMKLPSHSKYVQSYTAMKFCQFCVIECVLRVCSGSAADHDVIGDCSHSLYLQSWARDGSVLQLFSSIVSPLYCVMRWVQG